MTLVFGNPIITPAYRQPRSNRWRKWVLPALGAGLTIAVIIGIVQARPYFVAKNFGVVEDGKIYRSGQLTGRMLRQVVHNDHIAVIVSLSTDATDGPDAQAEAGLAESLGVKRYSFPLGGNGVGDPENYVKAIQVVCDSKAIGQAVLVHCEAGSQRTSGVIGVYEMLVKHRPADEAWKDMLRYKHDPAKNPSLRPFVNEHMKQWAMELKDLKIIDRIPEPLPQLP